MDAIPRDPYGGFYGHHSTTDHWYQSDKQLFERLTETYEQRPRDSHGSMFGGDIRGTSDYTFNLPPALARIAKNIGELNAGNRDQSIKLANVLDSNLDLKTGTDDQMYY